MNYLAPLETYSNIMVTGQGARTITGIETGLDWRTASEKQLAAIPGISAKGAWNLIGTRAKAISKGRTLEDIDQWFSSAGVQIPEIVDISQILS